MRLQTYYYLFTLYGVPVHAHMTVVLLFIFLLLLGLAGGVPLLFGAVAWLTLILMHELGHAAVAHYLGRRVLAIYLSPVHGLCVYEASGSLYDECLVAWGGVSAQALLFLLAIAFWAVAGSSLPDVLNIVLIVFTYTNVGILLTNLAPVPPFDGATAWGIFRAPRGAASRRFR